MRTITLPAADYCRIVEYNDTYFMRYAPTENDGEITAGEVVTIVPSATYATLVAALVHTRYTADAETAIIANYLADPDNTDHRDEFDAYQSWRAEVKAACKEYFGTE